MGGSQPFAWPGLQPTLTSSLPAHLQTHDRPLGLGRSHNPAGHGQPVQRLNAGMGCPCGCRCLGCCCCRRRIRCAHGCCLGRGRLSGRLLRRLGGAAARGCICCGACFGAEACCLPPSNLCEAQRGTQAVSDGGLAAAGGGSGGRAAGRVGGRAIGIECTPARLVAGTARLSTARFAAAFPLALSLNPNCCKGAAGEMTLPAPCKWWERWGQRAGCQRAAWGGRAGAGCAVGAAGYSDASIELCTLRRAARSPLPSPQPPMHDAPPEQRAYCKPVYCCLTVHTAGSTSIAGSPRGSRPWPLPARWHTAGVAAARRALHTLCTHQQRPVSPTLQLDTVTVAPERNNPANEPGCGPEWPAAG